MQDKEVVYCRWSPSLGALEGTDDKVWGTLPYPSDPDFPKQGKPAVFFGVYGLPDFYAVWRHVGKKYILWAGSDIIHLKNGYWLEEGGGIKLDPKAMGEWLNKHCENWCENEVEQNALSHVGIKAQICPSFLGDKESFPIHFEQSDRPKLYTSVSGDNFDMYGWHWIPKLARENNDVEFHLYGNTKPAIEYFGSDNMLPNMIDHGRIPKLQMNEEIKKMHGGLRLTIFDGFSEIVAKSILWGQYPVSIIEYPHMLGVNEIHKLKEKKEPNTIGRSFYRDVVNCFPWNIINNQ